MPEQSGPITVCRVDQGNWRTYREVRLAMLLDAPKAFGGTYEEAASRTDEAWLGRLQSMTTWLAVRDGRQPVGVVSLYHFEEQAADEICLIGMWVSPDARGHGVGRLLVSTAVDHAAGAGLARVTLDVADHNEAARRLYEAMGFAPTGRTGTLPHDPSITEFEMARDLRPPGTRPAD